MQTSKSTLSQSNKKNENKHFDGICCLIQLTDGRLVSGSFDFSIKLWKLKRELNCIATLIGHTDTVCSLLELDNDKVASCSWDSTMKIWNSTTYQLISNIMIFEDSFYKIIRLNNGVIASGSWNNTIYLWDKPSFKPIEALSGHKAGIPSLFQLKDGRLASGSYDHDIKVWDMETMKCIQTLIGHKDHVMCLIQMEDGKLASSSYEGVILFWELKGNKWACVRRIEENKSFTLCLLQVNFLWLISGGNKLKVWDCNTFVCIKTIKCIKSTIQAIILLPDERIVCASKDKQLLIVKLQ